jgi:hypothetical protein
MQAMYEGNISQDQAIAAIARAQQLNVPVMLADVGGQPVQRLTRSVRTKLAPAARWLMRRLRQEPEAVLGG